MAQSTWLTLIVPGSSAVLAQSAEANVHANVTDRAQLARIAGRGSLRLAWDRRDLRYAALQSWQRGLLAALELSEARFASAPVSVRGSDERFTGGYWMHIEPVHFVAGLDHLSFLPLTGEARVLEAERVSIESQLAEHLQTGGLRLHVSGDGSWYLQSDRALEVETSSPDAAAATELNRTMPRGPDAGMLRRLMTELQMLLHDHPGNHARIRRGLPAINAVWLWGGGVLEKVEPRALPPAFADAAYLRGIYALHDQPVSPAAANSDSLLSLISGTQRALAVISVTEPMLLEEQWIAPLTHALSSGRLSRLDLVLDGWHLQISRAELRRFWRKALPPTEWIA